MQVELNINLYPKVAVLKAAYLFTDIAYIYIDILNDKYIVDIEPKDMSSEICHKEFMNEVLSQTIRYSVYKRTKNIRELLLARALASTLIESDEIDYLPCEDDNVNADSILKDWFKNDVD